ncbi:hypothetical protein [Gluconobacter oxydans]|uniref:hypothetical protein n=1 Tax=Gluconobacter oxydans TaxID=442 RepID=UPI001559A224|nr:hypothetical protein [Gluconobacter oxydans]
MYVLDTSVIAYTNTDCLLKSIGCGNAFVPYHVALELISRVGAAQDDEEFRGAAGRALRASKFKILDDPFRVLNEAGVTRADPSRKKERLMMEQALSLLEQSRDRVDFFSRNLIFDDGISMPCSYLANFRQMSVETHKIEYLRMLEKISRVLNLDPNQNKNHVINQDIISGIISGFAWSAQKKNLDKENSFDYCILYFGFIVMSLIDYANKREKGQNPFCLSLVDPNDAEDAFNILNLSISSGRIFVTRDKKIIRRVSSFVMLLRENIHVPLVFKEKLQECEFVISQNEFIGKQL